MDALAQPEHNQMVVAHDNYVERDFYYTYNGRLVYDLSTVPKDAVVHKHYRLRGGKGGFGSMLRAIGSQIEKTTNHEMCRDLSGRRMRDVNTERKLREWYAKASDREREKLEKYHERRKRRQELLAKGPLPDHKFSDSKYERQKRKISHELHGALDVAIASILNEKRAPKSVSTSSSSSEAASKPKKSRLWIEKLDGDFSSSSSFSSDVSTDDENEPLTKEQQSLEENSTSGLTETSLTEDSSVPTASTSAELNKSEIDVKKTSNQAMNSNRQDSSAPNSSAVPLTDEQLRTTPSAEKLEEFGLEVLKVTLIARGLKCGGTLSERAVRLFSVRDLDPQDYPAKLRVKPKPATST